MIEALLLLFFLAASPIGMPAAPVPDLFNDPVLPTYKIQVAESGLAVLQRNDRSYVRATVTEGTNVLRDVGIHLKGMGSFRPFNEKPSIAVKFDRYVPRQRYRGLTKIMLNNASQDGTYLGEWIATRMFREAGVPAARVTHAFVEVNGRALGLYVVIEAMNKEFLRQHFENPTGNLYEAYLQDIDQPLDLDGGVDGNQSDLKKLLAVCKLTDREERWRRLPEVLNVDGYLSHLAMEMFTSHTDGYALNRNNYRLYRDPLTDRFVFLTHGIDWAFQNTGVAVRPPVNTIVTRAVLETPEGRRQYWQRARLLFTNVFEVTRLTNQINEAAARLQAAARNTNEAREFAGFAAEMRNRIVARHKNIADQFAAPEPVPLKFAADGTARLTEWTNRIEAGRTNDIVRDRPLVDGRPTLHLQFLASKGTNIASWRTKVFLEEGRYTLEGRVRTAGVTSLTNELKLGNGAGLRISGEKRIHGLTGTNDWTECRHEFETLPGGDEKVIVCELRGREGEAWFDPDSLMIRRRP